MRLIQGQQLTLFEVQIYGEEVEGQGGAGAGALAVPGGEVVGRELLGPRPAPLFVTNATGGGGNVRLLGRRRRARAGR